MTVERRTSIVAPAIASAPSPIPTPGPQAAALKLSGATLVVANQTQYIWSPTVIEYNTGGVFSVSPLWSTGYGQVTISAPGSYYFHMSASAKEPADSSWLSSIDVYAQAGWTGSVPVFVLGDAVGQPALVLLGQRFVSVDCGMYFSFPRPPPGAAPAGTLFFTISTGLYGGGVTMAVSCFMVAPA